MNNECSIDYNPRWGSSFYDDHHLMGYISHLTNTGEESDDSPVHRNLYFLRNQNEEIEYFLGIGNFPQRMRLRELIERALVGVHFWQCRMNTVIIKTPLRKEEAYDEFSRLTEEVLPRIWADTFPDRDGKDFLDRTIALVLHIEDGYQHIHHLYRI